MNNKGKVSSEANSTQKGDGPGANTTLPAGAKNVADKPAATLKLDPKLWEQIGVGSLVIAPEKNAKADGYWPATVTAVSKNGQMLTVRWIQFPAQPALTVKRDAVALLLKQS